MAVMTCVRDIRATGGGVTGVAVPLHQAICALDKDSKLAYGISDSLTIPGCVDMTSTGRGFTRPFVGGRADVMHVHGLWTPFELRACKYALQNGIPLVVSPHGMLEPWAMKHKRWKKRLAWLIYQKRVLEKSSLFVVNSRQEYLTVRRMGLDGPVAIIENGIDISAFSEPATQASREKTVLFLSRLSPVKGLPDLIDAWSALPQRHGFRLKVYGHADSGYEEVIRRKVQDCGVASSVDICGPVFGAEKWRVYGRSAIFVLPSYSENFGIVIAEAMFAGLPVITTHATPWQCLPQNSMGWQVHNDPRELTDALQQAMQLSDSQLRDIGGRAATYARQHFLWTEIARKYIVTYDWLNGCSSNRPSWIELD